MKVRGVKAVKAVKAIRKGEIENDLRNGPQKPMYAGLSVPLQGGRLLLGRCI